MVVVGGKEEGKVQNGDKHIWIGGNREKVTKGGGRKGT